MKKTPTEKNGPEKAELLAPAGSFAALKAAIEAGADAVYLGLKKLNARRPAKNFTESELAEAVALARRNGRRIYVTLNTDVKQSEWDEVIRALDAITRAGADAAIVRDPGVLGLIRACYPELEVHLSTQAAVTNVKGVLAAAELSATRVIVARELGLDELHALKNDRIEIEAFVQGSMCFSVSGRCLLSSWVGGRSGNRGACMAPCRVPYRNSSGRQARFFSMSDLGLIDRLDDLAAAGVSALKIEGRLKKPAWVRAIVALYRKALDDPEFRVTDADLDVLKNYSGRTIREGYLGDRGNLIFADEPPALQSAADRAPAEEVVRKRPQIGLRLDVHDGTMTLEIEMSGEQRAIRRPYREPRKTRRGIDAAEALTRIAQVIPDGFEPAPAARCVNVLFSRSQINALAADVKSAIREIERGEPSGGVKNEAAENFVRRKRHAPGAQIVGAWPRWIRVGAGDYYEEIARRFEGVTVGITLDDDVSSVPQSRVLALPDVIWQNELDLWEEKIAALIGHGFTKFEANDLSALVLLRDRSVKIECGPGLGILNAVAADELARFGARGFYASPECDRAALDHLSRTAGHPLSCVVFARPSLFTSRASSPEFRSGATFTDALRHRLVTSGSGDTLTFYPSSGFALIGEKFKSMNVGIDRLVADVTNSPDPEGDLKKLAEMDERVFAGFSSFNFERRLA